MLLLAMAAAGPAQAANPPSSGVAPEVRAVCQAPSWVPGKPYPAMSIVRHRGALHFAKRANPGYVPTISTYFWGEFACPAEVAGCVFADWMQDWQYRAGDVVLYEGHLYVAKHDNPGYVPTISTYFWAPHRCTDNLRSTSAGP